MLTKLLQSSWRLRARCRTVDPDVFFHPEGERDPARSERVKRATDCCSCCPVIRECAEYAMDAREGFGTWGGVSENDRIATLLANGLRPRGRSVHA